MGCCGGWEVDLSGGLLWVDGKESEPVGRRANGKGATESVRSRRGRGDSGWPEKKS